MNRPIALVSAMREELDAVLARLPDARVERVAGRDFLHGHWDGLPVVATLSGIGKVAAATTAVLLAEHCRARAIVFTGVAGGLGAGVRVGDVVVARSFLQHDLDASPIFPKYVVPGHGRARYEADAAWTDALCVAAGAALENLGRHGLADALQALGLGRPRLHQGLLISGDRFVSTAEESRALQHALPDALAVEMEGAAFAQVCHDCRVPLAVVRTISDRADDAAHADFMRFVRTVASPYSLAVIDALLDNIKNNSAH